MKYSLPKDQIRLRQLRQPNGLAVLSYRSSVSTVSLRAWTVLVSIAYAGCMAHAYSFYLSPIWAYLGYPEFEPERSGGTLALAFSGTAVFALVLPPVIIRYSQFVIWFLFYYLFIPCVIVAAMQGKAGNLVVACVILSFGLIATIPKLLPAKSSLAQVALEFEQPLRAPKSVTGFEFGFLISLLLFLGVVLLIFGGNLRLSSFFEVYEQRAIASELAGDGTLAAYVLQWVTRAFAPFAVAYGLMFSRKLFVALGLLAFVISYMAQGAKFIPLGIVLLYITYWYILRRREILAVRIGLVPLAGLVAPLTFMTLYGLTGHEGSTEIILSQAVGRLYGTSGMTLGLYAEFFDFNPRTYFSHIGLLRSFIQYPYGSLSVGQMVGHWVLNHTEYNASANFWSTDGIAAIGNIGVVLIGCILGGLLACMDHWVTPRALRLMCLSSLMTMWSLVDSSLFSTLLTGGWPFHFLLVSGALMSLASSPRRRDSLRPAVPGTDHR